MKEFKFKFGDVVMLKEGCQIGNKGVVIGVPDPAYSRTSYIVSTFDYLGGEWISEDGMERLPYNTENQQYRDALLKMKGLFMDDHGTAPPDVNPYEYFNEMARIYPNYNADNNIKNGFVVDVNSREGLYPHVHVRYSRFDVAYIRLDEAKYMPGHKKYTLNKHQRQALQDFFETVIPDTEKEYVGITCWKAAAERIRSNLETKSKEYEVFVKLMAHKLDRYFTFTGRFDDELNKKGDFSYRGSEYVYKDIPDYASGISDTRED